MANAAYTEDQVRDLARTKLHLEETESAQAGVGQLTSFNQLGFRGVKDRPDGWYLPNETHYPALILEVKGSNIKLGEKEREELQKNIRIVQTRYKQVVGLLYNGYELEVYKDGELVEGENELMDKEHYLGLFSTNRINKMLIYSLTHSINDTLHFDFLIKISDVVTDCIDGTALAGNLCIQNHQVLQALLDILLGIGQTALLLLDLLLYLFALLLQSLYRGRLFGRLGALGRLLGFGFFPGGSGLLSRRLTTLLSLRCQGKTQ